jgi:hypothetical protein
MSVPASTFDTDILPAEGFSYVLVDPGVFQDIEWFSYGKMLVLELEEEGIDNVKVSLVRTGIFDIFDDEIIAELPRDYAIRNAVTQAEALDGSRSLVGSHVCKIIEVHSGNRLWMYGTISDCEWNEHESMSIFYLASSEDDLLIPVKCPAKAWPILDMNNFALCLFNKASGGLYRFLLVTDKTQTAYGLHYGVR